MPGRDFLIHGEVLARVKFGGHVSGSLYGGITSGVYSNLSELGLCEDDVRVSVRLYHKGVQADDFGDRAYPEYMSMLADATVSLNLMHYDPAVLDQCVMEAMAGGCPGAGLQSPVATPSQIWNILNTAGGFAGAGALMGNNRPPLSSGCHYVSLNLSPPSIDFPWRFPTAFLAEQPNEWPMGTEAKAVRLTFQAVGYAPLVSRSLAQFNPGMVVGDVVSSGVFLFDHLADF